MDVRLPKSASEDHREKQRIAQQAMEHHRLVQAGSDRWLLKAPRDNSYWAEVVYLLGQKVLVHGDIEPVIFVYGNQDDTPTQCVAGLAAAPLGCDYVVNKAVVGSGYERVYEYDPCVALYDLEDRLVDGDARPSVQRAIEGLRAVYELNEVKQELLDAGEEREWVSSLGRVAHLRVYMAHAAIRRLQELRVTAPPVKRRIYAHHRVGPYIAIPSESGIELAKSLLKDESVDWTALEIDVSHCKGIISAFFHGFLQHIAEMRPELLDSACRVVWIAEFPWQLDNIRRGIEQFSSTLAKVSSIKLDPKELEHIFAQAAELDAQMERGEHSVGEEKDTP